MRRRFGGWSEGAFDVLLRLEGEPPSAVRERLREERERLVREPMVALMHDLADTDAFYSRFTVPGFHKLVEPWQRQVGVVRPERHVDQRVIFDLDGLHIEGSGWYFNPGSYVSPNAKPLSQPPPTTPPARATRPQNRAYGRRMKSTTSTRPTKTSATTTQMTMATAMVDRVRRATVRGGSGWVTPRSQPGRTLPARMRFSIRQR